MKKNILILISFCFILTSCSLSDDTQSNPVVTKNIWHLVAVNGGIAGINEQFSTGTIIWEKTYGTAQFDRIEKSKGMLVHDNHIYIVGRTSSGSTAASR